MAKRACNIFDDTSDEEKGDQFSDEDKKSEDGDAPINVAPNRNLN